jgi:protease IV
MRFLVNFLRKLWHGLDVFRRVLHLLLLLIIFAVIIGAVGSVGGLKLPEHGVLLLRPSGEIVEQLSGEPLQRAINEAQGQAPPETLLWDLTEAIRAGAKDKRVQALLIDTDDLESAGQAKLEELAAAIAEFRKSGKKVIARGANFDQTAYYLAAQADEVYLDPLGNVILTGYGRYTPYLKAALDKLKVDVHLYRAGKYKSAAEMFMRDDQSPEDREESLAYLNALWQNYCAAVARARGKKPGDIEGYVDNFAAQVTAAGGNMAKVALDAGLVTALKTSTEVDARMVELVGSDPDSNDDDAFPAIEQAAYIKHLRAEHRRAPTAGAAVAVVVASGEMQDGEQLPGSIGGDSLAAQLHEARLDDDVKAVVLRVDSPGGSAFAAEVIRRELLAIKADGKKLVVSMSDYAASGGYWIATPADQIIASPNTLTGSIGAFTVAPTLDRSLAAAGVHVDGAGTTPLAGAGGMLRPELPAVGQLRQGAISYIYEQFLQHVADGRHKTRDAVDAIGQGRVWVGGDALRRGLIDRTGTYADALAAAAQLARLPAGYRIRHIEPEIGMTERLLLSLQGDSVRLLRAAGVGAANPLQQWLRPLQPVEREMARLQRFATARGAVVYCFCGAD